MKTLFKSLALALLLGFVTTAATLAETNSIGIDRPASVATYKTGVYSTVAGTLRVAVDKEVGGSVDIRLKSASGKSVYRHHLGKNEQNCRLRLNLSNLEDGVYQLEITNGTDTTTQNVTLTKYPVSPSRIISIN